MKIRYFKHGVGNSWELNFIGSHWNLRIARYQLALWHDNESILNTWRFS